ncbi:hypothetical protein G9U51_08360 [Calidifontibacter sp. DB0510]|uniref:DNA-binding protein n=1 Tax=Metallococcus carri TaxID=1656884 RepID=A0A967EH10_9MICO|nr:hypothetical protein [Metallococcus carri]NHN55788.1 hypothetical protein [Metallococcus carri]NOP38523.1 hypothetical protein [Calidifontibacter sp. DB2511S]
MGDSIFLRTADAAQMVGVGEGSFRTWARRRDLAPARVVRMGRARVAVWDAGEVLAATGRTPRPWREQEQQ